MVKEIHFLANEYSGYILPMWWQTLFYWKSFLKSLSGTLASDDVLKKF